MRRSKLFTFALLAAIGSGALANALAITRPLPDTPAVAPQLRDLPSSAAAVPDVARLFAEYGDERGLRPFLFSVADTGDHDKPDSTPEPAHALVSLKGIILASGTSTALVVRTGSSKVIRLREGDRLDGWLVEKISQKSIRLSSGREARLLSLGSTTE